VPNNFSFGANAGLASAAGTGVTIVGSVDFWVVMTCEVTLCEALANNWQLLAKASLNKSSLPIFEVIG